MSLEHDHVVIAFDFLEGAGEKFFRILVVAGEPILKGAGDALGRIAQAFARRIVAGPVQKRADGVFRLLARRAGIPGPRPVTAGTFWGLRTWPLRWLKTEDLRPAHPADQPRVGR